MNTHPGFIRCDSIFIYHHGEKPKKTGSLPKQPCKLRVYYAYKLGPSSRARVTLTFDIPELNFQMALLLIKQNNCAIM